MDVNKDGTISVDEFYKGIYIFIYLFIYLSYIYLSINILICLSISIFCHTNIRCVLAHFLLKLWNIKLLVK